MKKIYKVSLVVFIMSALSACSVKTTNSTPSTATAPTTAGTSPTTGTPGSTTGNSTTTGGVACDGVDRGTGATQCYYKNIPTIQVMGATAAATSAGTPFWSSSTLTTNGSGISPNQFATDGVFNVRIIPRLTSSTYTLANPSFSGKSCSDLMTKAKKIYVQIKLRDANSTTGATAQLAAEIDKPSNVWHFTPPVSTQPLVLEVVNVMADIRCTDSGGKSYCPYADIPINYADKNYPTECVAFDIQYSTDTTLDLPGAAAN